MNKDAMALYETIWENLRKLDAEHPEEVANIGLALDTLLDEVLH